MDAEPIGKPGWPELAFCTMSTARKRRVLMHNSSNAGGAMGAESVAEDDMRCSLPIIVEMGWTSHGDSRLIVRRESGSLHLEANIPDAFRMLALARCLWTLLCICIRTCCTAMLFAALGLTITTWVYALFLSRHKCSFCPNMPSLFWRLCCTLNIHAALEACSDITTRLTAIFSAARTGNPRYAGCVRWSRARSKECI